MDAAGFQGRRDLCRQVSDAVLCISREVAAADGRPCADISVLVAQYACEGFFAAQMSGVSYLGAAGGHWWTLTIDKRHSVCSSHFPEAVPIELQWPKAILQSARQVSVFMGELVDGSLLLVEAWIYGLATWVLECVSVAKDGSVRRLWGVGFTERRLRFSEAALVHAVSSYLVIPSDDGLIAFDALKGGGPERIQVPLHMSDCDVFQGGGDLLLFVCHASRRVHVFSWSVQRIVADWPNPLMTVHAAFVDSGSTVQLIDFGLGGCVTCNPLTGAVLNTVRRAVPPENRVPTTLVTLEPTWSTVRQSRGLVYLVL